MWIIYNRFSISACLRCRDEGCYQRRPPHQVPKGGERIVTAEEERKFWEMNLLETSSAKSLLYTVYFYNGKIFGLQGGDHRDIVLNNFELESNFIKFQENSCKTFHGGVSVTKNYCVTSSSKIREYANSSQIF